MKRPIGEYTLYRLRYKIGITIGLLLSAVLFALAANYVPGGIRHAEMTSTIASANLSFDSIDPINIVNLPYHLLQHVSFAIFGVSLLSIKIPSIIFAFGALAGLFLLVREWFRTNSAVITSIIVVALPAFIFAAQDGTSVMYTICLSIWLLTAGTYATRNIRPTLLWKSLFAIFFALNFYAPLGIYLNTALVVMAIFHPHIRHFIRRISKLRLLFGGVICLILLAPLIWRLIAEPEIILSLLGIPQNTGSLFDNFLNLGRLLFNFSGHTVIGGIASPFLSFGLCLILTLGVYYFVRIRYTAQSFILSIWAAILLALSIINPENSLYLLIVIMLLIASAVNGLLSSWYRIFPSNPYAHIVALFPCAAIVAGLFVSGIIQYSGAYYYNQRVVDDFSSDIKLLPRALKAVDASAQSPATIVVDARDQAFYDTIAKYNRDMRVTTQGDESTDKLIVSGAAPVSQRPTSQQATEELRASQQSTPEQSASQESLPKVLELKKIITNRLAASSDRFYIYTPAQK